MRARVKVHACINEQYTRMRGIELQGVINILVEHLSEESILRRLFSASLRST